MGWALVDRWAFVLWCVWTACQLGWYLVSPSTFLARWAGLPLAPEQVSDLMPPFGLILEVPGWFILFKSVIGVPALMTLCLVLLVDGWRALRPGPGGGGKDSTWAGDPERARRARQTGAGRR
jgi:hypothetical protein